MRVLRQVLLGVSRSDTLRAVVESAPVSRDVVARFVAGTTTGDAVAVAARLIDAGLYVSLDHLGEDTRYPAQAEAMTRAYEDVLRAVSEAGLAARSEVSVKLSAIGQALPGDGAGVTLDNARRICRAAAASGSMVTLDMEDHATTDATLDAVRRLRVDFPATGVAVQAYLRRSEADCRALAGTGSRVRLCKGAYQEPDSVAYTTRGEVDRSYVRCLKVLMAGEGYPMVATHDPRLVEIAGALATRHGRRPGDYEYQMLFGVRPEEQRRLARAGETVRVYLPYGEEWYGYLVRRMAERPANLGVFLRALATKG